MCATLAFSYTCGHAIPRNRTLCPTHALAVQRGVALPAAACATGYDRADRVDQPDQCLMCRMGGLSLGLDLGGAGVVRGPSVFGLGSGVRWPAPGPAAGGGGPVVLGVGGGGRGAGAGAGGDGRAGEEGAIRDAAAAMAVIGLAVDVGWLSRYVRT